jgi:hypothetical protein
MTMKRANLSVTASQSMTRILTDMKAFSDRVESYLNDSTNPDRHKDACEAAYEGLYKLMQRIEKELKEGSLNNPEKRICNKIVQDNYLKGLLPLRTIAAHIKSDTAQKQGCVHLYLPSGPPVSIDPNLSSGAVFVKPSFQLQISTSGISEIRHPELLQTAKTRLEKLFGTTHRGS